MNFLASPQFKILWRSFYNRKENNLHENYVQPKKKSHKSLKNNFNSKEIMTNFVGIQP